MHIHFKELGLTKYSRDEIYTSADLIGEKNLYYKEVQRREHVLIIFQPHVVAS